MATRTDNAVTLSHEQAKVVVDLLTDYKATLTRQRERGRHQPATLAAMGQTINQCESLAMKITAELWTWESDLTHEEGTP